MSDDKKKAKDAILGELESIKHLLEESQEDDYDEPPVLTDHFNDVADDTDVPMLTEALNEVLDDIRSSDSDDDFESLDIPVLTPIDDNIGNSKKPSAHNDADDAIPVLEPLTDDSLIHDDAQFLDTDADNYDDIPTLETAAAPVINHEEPSDNSDDDLVARALKSHSSKPAPSPSAKETIASPEVEAVTEQDSGPASEPESEAEPEAAAQAETADTEKTEPSDEADDVFDLEALDHDEPDDLAANAPSKQTEATPSKQPTEHQPSLFDAPKPQPQPQPAAKPSQPAAKVQPPQVERAVKTDNPFLPKHIRDRLHTNRTLQQEIESNHRQAAPPAAAAPKSSVTPSQSTSDPASQGPSTSAADDRLVDEVIKSLLPKFEQELRAKVREIIAAERKNSPEK